jgi:predicted nucleic acid-binding protein
VDRVLLDANVLFSAAYRPDSGTAKLWDLEDVQLVTSEYAAEEARRSLPEGDQRLRLEDRLVDVEVSMAMDSTQVPGEDVLPEKDRPILRAAVAVGATHLLTGDVTHFGRLFGDEVSGVLILRPATYLRSV